MTTSDDLARDAARYRALRDAGSRLKIYVYDDPNDEGDFGDWYYKPGAERVDAFADELVSALERTTP